MFRHISGWHILQGKAIASNSFCAFETRSIKHDKGPEIPDYLVYRLRNFVQVIGLSPSGNLVLVREDKKVGGWLYEAVGGAIQDGENPATAAAREFNEETDWEAGRIEILGQFAPDASKGASLSAREELLIGFLCVAFDLTPSPPRRSPDEIIQTVELKPAVALASVLSQPYALPRSGFPIMGAGTQILILKMALLKII